MTDETTQTDTGGTVWDDPNRQVLGLDPAWVEGTGGGSSAEGGQTAAENPLDAMTKDQLLAYAQERNITPANAGMTKDEIRASIDAAGG